MDNDEDDFDFYSDPVRSPPHELRPDNNRWHSDFFIDNIPGLPQDEAPVPAEIPAPFAQHQPLLQQQQFLWNRPAQPQPPQPPPPQADPDPPPPPRPRPPPGPPQPLPPEQCQRQVNGVGVEVPNGQVPEVNFIPILTDALSNVNPVERGQITEALLNLLLSPEKRNMILEYPPGIHGVILILAAVLDYWIWRKKEVQPSTSTAPKRPKNDDDEEEQRQKARNPRKIILATHSATQTLNLIGNILELLMARLSNITMAVINSTLTNIESGLDVEGHQNEVPESFNILCNGAEVLQGENSGLGFPGQADIVICPQSAIVSPLLRAKYQIDLKDAFVICDDGSDIERVCRMETAVQISSNELNRIIEISRRFQNMDGPEAEFLEILQTLSRWLREVNTVENKVEILDKLEEDLRFRAISQQTLQHFSGRLENLMTHGEINDNIDLALLKKFRKFLWILPMVLEDPINFSLSVSDDLAIPANDRSNFLKIYCANPALTFAEIGDLSMCIILSGSAMAPYDSFDTEMRGYGLGVTFSEILRVTFANGNDTLMREDFLFTSCSVGPRNEALELSKKTRARPAVMAEVLGAVAEICETVPGGIVISCLSGAYLNILMADRRDLFGNVNSLFREMNRFKHVIVENTDNELREDRRRSVDDLIQEFRVRAENPEDGRNGAVLVILHRGQIYSRLGDLLQQHGVSVGAVVHIGIPFAAWYHDDFVTSKRDYFESLGVVSNNLEWYCKEAFRLLNLSFAQVCSGGGFGMVIVLDARLFPREDSLHDLIPTWVMEANSRHFDEEVDAEGEGGFQRMMTVIREMVGGIANGVGDNDNHVDFQPVDEDEDL